MAVVQQSAHGRAWIAGVVERTGDSGPVSKRSQGGAAGSTQFVEKTVSERQPGDGHA